MKHQSFTNNKQKSIKIWNQTVDNETAIKNFIETFPIDVNKKYNSLHYFKAGTTIELLDVNLGAESFVTYQFEIKNFSEELVSFSKVQTIISFPSIIDLTNTVDSFSVAFANGTLKTGDISIITNHVIHWWTKIGDTSWHLNVGIDLNVRQATVSEFGFSSSQLENTQIKINLIILNGREFNEFQSGK